jgi:kynurenine formamidase
MKVIDLTRAITSDMQMYPGSEQPSIRHVSSVPEEGYRESVFVLSSHTGTHIDAPAHMIEDGKKLEDYPVSAFWGKAVIIDCSGLDKGQIETDDLLIANRRIEEIEKIDYVLLKTGWGKYWGTDMYYEPFPSLTVEAAQYLADNRIKGIGTDTLSIDTIDSDNFPVHHVLFRQDILVVENLANLDDIASETFYFSCMPLKMEDSEASPVRAFAVEFL